LANDEAERRKTESWLVVQRLASQRDDAFGEEP
jgi:hypothetical protein